MEQKKFMSVCIKLKNDHLPLKSPILTPINGGNLILRIQKMLGSKLKLPFKNGHKYGRSWRFKVSIFQAI